jgi:hypothetical protein
MHETVLALLRGYGDFDPSFAHAQTGPGGFCEITREERRLTFFFV